MKFIKVVFFSACYFNFIMHASEVDGSLYAQLRTDLNALKPSEDLPRSITGAWEVDYRYLVELRQCILSDDSHLSELMCYVTTSGAFKRAGSQSGSWYGTPAKQAIVAQVALNVYREYETKLKQLEALKLSYSQINQGSSGLQSDVALWAWRSGTLSLGLGTALLYRNMFFSCGDYS